MILTDEQIMIKDMVAKLSRNEILPLAKDADIAGHSSPEIVKLLAENGLLKMALPEEYDGINADYTTIALVVEELAKEYGEQAVIGKVDVDNNREIAQKYGIRNIPTLLIFKDGEIVDKQVGVASKSVLESKLTAQF